MGRLAAELVGAWERSAMVGMLPSWAWTALGRKRGGLGLRAVVASLCDLVVAKSPRARAPLEPAELSEFMERARRSGLSASRLCMAAMLVRDVEMAARVGELGSADLDGPMDEDELRLAFGFVDRPAGEAAAEWGRWRAMPAREALGEMARDLGHGARDCLDAFMAGQEANGLARAAGDVHGGVPGRRGARL